MSYNKLLIILIVLLSCTSKQREISQHSKGGLIQNQPAITNQSTNDSLLVPPFEVEIVLSEKAKERMSNPKESIIVFVEFSGEPKDTISEGLNEVGQLMLGSIKMEITQPWIAKIDNIFISEKVYDRLKNKDFDVSIQIWTGRRSSELNLLFGDLISGEISKIKDKRHKLNAKLIGE